MKQELSKLIKSFEIIEIYPDYKISAIDITNLALIRIKY